ncbi:DUF6764 family protein [Rhodococcoides fascians]|uniref:DUF6764 family protein n=1 Tax=Rhodococcoides fascians TaxID=1828 RepID=UPI0018DA29AE|nr:DUF6764 family protein [Rhodococcus fascians]
MFSVSQPRRSSSYSSTTRSSSRFGSRIARTAAIFALGSGMTAAALVGAGTASAAPVNCVSPPSANDIQVDGTASCGATSEGTGRATAGAADSGTAVSVNDGPGATTTYANGYGVALGASKNAGTAYALALGGGIAHSWADAGQTTLAVAGWGSGATSEGQGVDCVGPLSLALNLSSGQFCVLGS